MEHSGLSDSFVNLQKLSLNGVGLTTIRHLPVLPALRKACGKLSGRERKFVCEREKGEREREREGKVGKKREREREREREGKVGEKREKGERERESEMEENS